MLWQPLDARITPGHRVASGLNGNPKFPGGTLLMQKPLFLQLGLDLTPFYQGTINVDIAPLRFQVRQPKLTFRQVAWHPIDPPEDFSFFDVRLRNLEEPIYGLIYFPHPETKPTHFQPPSAMELLFPFLEGVHYGMTLHLEIPSDQMLIA